MKLWLACAHGAGRGFCFNFIDLELVFLVLLLLVLIVVVVLLRRPQQTGRSLLLGLELFALSASVRENPRIKTHESRYRVSVSPPFVRACRRVFLPPYLSLSLAPN